jgi:hypothetical protein
VVPGTVWLRPSIPARRIYRTPGFSSLGATVLGQVRTRHFRDWSCRSRRAAGPAPTTPLAFPFFYLTSTWVSLWALRGHEGQARPGGGKMWEGNEAGLCTFTWCCLVTKRANAETHFL